MNNDNVSVRPLEALNMLVSFSAEMVMLVLLALSGYKVVESPRWASYGFAILLPLVVIAVWGYALAPRSKHRLPQPWLCTAQIFLFALTALLRFAYVSHVAAVVFIVPAVASSLVAMKMSYVA